MEAMNRMRNAVHRGWVAAAVLGGLWVMIGAAVPGVRIGVVDADRVRLDSVSLQRELKEASAPAEAVQEQLKAKQAELQAALERYQAQQSALTAEVNQQRLAELQRLATEAQTLSRRLSDALSEAEQNRLEPMRLRVMNAIEAVARDRGLDMVLSTDRVLYFRPETDLTRLVIERLDAQAR